MRSHLNLGYVKADDVHVNTIKFVIIALIMMLPSESHVSIKYIDVTPLIFFLSFLFFFSLFFLHMSK